MTNRYNAGVCITVMALLTVFAIGCGQKADIDEDMFSIKEARLAAEQGLVECQTAASECIINASSVEELIACRGELESCIDIARGFVEEATAGLQECRTAARECISGDSSISECREAFNTCVTDVVPFDDILDALPGGGLPDLGDLVPSGIATECLTQINVCLDTGGAIQDCLAEVVTCMQDGIGDLPGLGDLPIDMGDLGIGCMTDLASCVRDGETSVAECARTARECVIDGLPFDILDPLDLLPTEEAITCMRETAECVQNAEDSEARAACIQAGRECIEGLIPVDIPQIGDLIPGDLPIIGGDLGLGCMQGLAECMMGGGSPMDCAAEARECMGDVIPGIGMGLPGLGEGLPGLGEGLPGIPDIGAGLDCMQGLTECMMGGGSPMDCAAEARECMGDVIPGIGMGLPDLGEGLPGLGEGLPGLGEGLPIPGLGEGLPEIPGLGDILPTLPVPDVGCMLTLPTCILQQSPMECAEQARECMGI